MPEPTTNPAGRPVSTYSPEAWQNLFDEDPDGWRDEATRTPRSNVFSADSPVHFICPDGSIDQLNPTVTHSLHPVANTLACRYCGKSEKQLREEIGL